MELPRSIAEMDDIEIECPICDRSIPAVSKKCQFCGTELSMSGLDELEELAMHVDEITLGAESAQREEEKVPASYDEVSSTDKIPVESVEVRYVRTEVDAEGTEDDSQQVETGAVEASSETMTGSKDESISSEMTAKERKQALKAEKREKRSQNKKDKREKRMQQKAEKREAKDGKSTEESSH